MIQHPHFLRKCAKWDHARPYLHSLVLQAKALNHTCLLSSLQFWKRNSGVYIRIDLITLTISNPLQVPRWRRQPFVKHTLLSTPSPMRKVASEGSWFVSQLRFPSKSWFTTKLAKYPGTPISVNTPLIRFQLIELAFRKAQHQPKFNAPLSKSTIVLIAYNKGWAQQHPHKRYGRPFHFRQWIQHSTSRSCDMMLYGRWLVEFEEKHQFLHSTRNIPSSKKTDMQIGHSPQYQCQSFAGHAIQTCFSYPSIYFRQFIIAN